MLHAFSAILGAALVVAACYTAGVLLMARAARSIGTPVKRFESIPLAFITGAACLQLLIFFTLALRIGYRAVWLAMIALLLWAASKVPLPGRGSALPAALRIGFGIIFAVFTVMYFAAAWAPEASPDGSSYHLEFVSRFVHAHRFFRIDNMYAALSEGIETLYVPAFAFGRHSAAALVHFAFLTALALAIFAYGRRIGNPWAGAAAALIVYMCPIVGRDGTTAYIDVAVAAIAFATFYWLEIWDERRADALLVPAGLLAGFGYAAKYTAAVMVIYAVAFVAWRARKWRPVTIVAGCAALMIAPWMIKDWWQYRDPVAPFAGEIFRNPYFHIWAIDDWAAWLRRYDIPSLWSLPLDVTVHGQYVQGIIGPVFLLAPVALLALRDRVGRRLLIAGALFLAVYFNNVGARFLIPALPFFALAMAIAIRVRALVVALVLADLIVSWPANIPRYAGTGAWHVKGLPFAAALRLTPERDFLRANADYDLVAMVEQKVPPGARVFTSEGFATAYTSRQVIVGYESAFNNLISDMLFMGFTEDYRPTKVAVFHFAERKFRRIRVLQSAQAKKGQMWDVHELRFYDRSTEIARQPQWRIAAWPNPRDAPLAFDNSEATRWRTWETAGPGDYLEVEFGEPTAIDEVQIETSNQSTWPMHLEIQARISESGWLPVTHQFEIQPRVVRGAIRREATYEMHRRGVDYLVILDTSWGAADIRDDPASWGLEAIGRSGNATLYQVIP